MLILIDYDLYYEHNTRKSSCVNARGIPTAAYQVLHVLTEVGYPPVGVPPHQGTPCPGLTGGTLGTPHPGLMVQV